MQIPCNTMVTNWRSVPSSYGCNFLWWCIMKTVFCGRKVKPLPLSKLPQTLVKECHVAGQSVSVMAHCAKHSWTLGKSTKIGLQGSFEDLIFTKRERSTFTFASTSTPHLPSNARSGWRFANKILWNQIVILVWSSYHHTHPLSSTVTQWEPSSPSAIMPWNR